MTRRAPLLLLALCCAIPLCAAPKDPWLRITSANFELFTTAGERSGRDLIRHFEQVRSFFTQAFGSKLASPKPARIIAFHSLDEYRPYRPNELATAFYQPGAGHDFIVMVNGGREHYDVAVHEFTHLMIHQSNLAVPVWLDEGMAELYSNLAPTGAKIVVGNVIAGRAQTLLRENWIDLRTVVAVDRNSPLYAERPKAGMFYAESWALVHMLNLDPAYRPQLRAMVEALKDGGAPAAFQKAYGKSIDQVQDDLRQYLTNATIHAAVFDIQLPRQVDSPAIETAAGLPARMALAELLTNTRAKLDQAGAMYQQLARDYPDRWEVEEGFAQWDWRQRRSDEALRHFARAAQLGCPNPRMFLEYAQVLGYGRRNEEAVTALQSAIKLDPGLEEAHLELGAAYVRIARYAEAIAELLQVKKVTPAAAPRYFYNLAYANYRLGDAAKARAFIEKGRPYATNPEEAAQLERLSQALGR
ncbi:MAG TPA: tetratricopeptide repeat protein [Candidatus Acidoferrales bacterium]|jgi:tetratricopeptide (TPR) repeat protein|nr:tetratricopeptide repeat protein [Candidatus Acidoferrales bacterium]